MDVTLQRPRCAPMVYNIFVSILVLMDVTLQQVEESFKRAKKERVSIHVLMDVTLQL